ncbi:MAG: hypothetical protein WBR15_07055 [Gammaproteobacteria bacterium]
MKSVFVRWVAITVAVVIGGLAYGSAQASAPRLPQYLVVNLGNPNGGIPNNGEISQGSSITNSGWIAGFATEPNGVFHAEAWVYGFPLDLGTLGGPSQPALNSAVAWPNRNEHGVVAGISETAAVNPLNENWSCSQAVFNNAIPNGVGQHVCLGFVWQNGAMSALPTLGGYDGFATGINNHDQIVGWAENTIHDRTCSNANGQSPGGQVLQFEAVKWSNENGHYVAEELPPYGNDQDGSATAINEEGQVVGISGLCGGAIGGETAEHMVMWQDDHVVQKLPGLGGSYWNTPMDINNRGDVVGFADLPGDGVGNPSFQPFYWSQRAFVCQQGQRPKAGICNLTPGVTGFSGEALGVNDRDQVVGVSFVTGHAFIWQDGFMTDLNTCVASGSANLVLTDAQEINDVGVITGQASDPATGTLVAFVAIPVGGTCPTN